MSSTRARQLRATRCQRSCHADDTLIIGLYDRCNLGDETYKMIMRLVLPVTDWDKVTYVCVDDLPLLSFDSATNTRCLKRVIVGGGDIIDTHSMPKILSFIQSLSHRPPVYAVSAGIVDTDCLSLFDHVFTRSERDTTIAAQHLGCEHVTHVPDLAWLLPKLAQQVSVTLPGALTSPPQLRRVAFCPARPMFAEDNSIFFQSVCEELCLLLKSQSNVELHLVPFNTHTTDESQSDLLLLHRIQQYMTEHAHDNLGRLCVHNVNIAELRSPLWVYSLLSSMDCVIASRYHSAVFALAARVPIVALYTDPQMEALLDDCCVPFDCRVKGPDSLTAASGYSQPGFLTALIGSVSDCTMRGPSVHCSLSAVASIIDSGSQQVTPAADQGAASVHMRIPECVGKLAGLDITAATDWYHGKLQHPMQPKVALDVAHLLCYLLTSGVSSTYVWGLFQKLQDPPPGWCPFAEVCGMMQESSHVLPALTTAIVQSIADAGLYFQVDAVTLMSHAR